MSINFYLWKKFKEFFSNDEVRTEVLACRDFLLFPPRELVINILEEMAIEVCDFYRDGLQLLF